MSASAAGFRRWILPFILFAHAAIVVWLSAVLNIWVDEAYTLETTSRDLAYTVRLALNFEGQPPFYFLVIWLLRRVTDSVFWLRGFSTVCTVLLLIVLAKISKRLFPTLHPAWIVGIAAFHPMIVWAGSELRVPALAMLLSALLFLLFIEGFLTETPRKRAVVAYGIVSVIALYSHYYLGFLLLANGLALLVTRRPKAILAYYATMAVVAVSILPMVAVLNTQFTLHRRYGSIDYGSYFKAVRFMIERTQKLILPTMGLGITGKIRWIVPGAIVAGIGAALYLRRRAIPPYLVPLLIATGLAVLVFAVPVWRMGTDLMQPRHYVGLLIPGYICIYSAIYLFDGARRRGILIAWTMIAVACGGFNLYQYNRDLAKAGDWKHVAEYIQANERPNEPILVFPAAFQLPFAYHYKGVNQARAIPRPEDFKSYNTDQHVLKSESEIFDVLATLPNRGNSLWIVNACDPDRPCGWLGQNYNVEILNAFVEKYYLVETEERFRTTLVKLCIESVSENDTE